MFKLCIWFDQLLSTQCIRSFFPRVILLLLIYILARKQEYDVTLYMVGVTEINKSFVVKIKMIYKKNFKVTLAGPRYIINLRNLVSLIYIEHVYTN